MPPERASLEAGARLNARTGTMRFAWEVEENLGDELGAREREPKVPAAAQTLDGAVACPEFFAKFLLQMCVERQLQAVAARGFNEQLRDIQND